MGIDVEMDFIRPKSYHGQDNSGGVRFIKELELDLKGKRVYIVEDMVDTGATMLEILQRVDSRQPAETSIVTLVHRKGSKHHVDFTAFEIGDEWVVGYGFDDNGLKRNYRNIYNIKKH
jgi:hypoxanthine phosphoribosyltransferase